MKPKNLTLVLFFLSIFAFSQEKKVIDSLINIANTSKDGLVKMNIYEKLTTLHWNINIKTAKIYSTLFFKQAEKNKDKTGILTAKIYEAVNSDIEGKTEIASKQFLAVYKEIKQSKNIHSDVVLAKYHYNHGNFFMGVNSTDSALTHYHKAVVFYNKIKDANTAARILLNIGYIQSKNNDFSESMQTYQSAISVLKTNKDWLGLSAVYGRIGFNYGVLKMHKKAIEYHKMGLLIDEKHNLINNKAYALGNIGSEYADMKQYTQAENYFLKSKIVFQAINDLDMVTAMDLDIFLIHIEQGKIKETLTELKKLEQNSTLDTKNKVNLFEALGTCFQKLQDFKTAEVYNEKALIIAKTIGKEDKLLDASYQYLIARLSNKKDDKSLQCLQLFDSLSKKKNEIENKNAFFDLETKYKTAEKDLQIQKEKTNKNFAFLGIFFITLMAVAGFWVYNNKKKRKEKALQIELDSLKNSINEMELQNLNQQIDPHEITNFIQSISANIQQKDEKMYTQINNLWEITTVVLNHKTLTANIKTEIEQLETYIQYQLEIAHPKFEYAINQNITNPNFKIPRLLLKNIVGNAIKHGLKGIEGKIDINISENENFVLLIVDDNGRGINKPQIHKGIGTSIYENIFTKLNLKNNEKATIEINNKEKGVKVVVTIPKNYVFEK